MNENGQNYDDIPMAEVIKTIKMLSILPHEKKNITLMASALGVYMCKLQKEFGYPPVFPIEMIPIQKEILKKWGFTYALLVVREQRILKQFQQEAVLCYTSFREMTESQWEAIKTGSVENIVLYNSEVRDKQSSDLPILTEFKVLIDSYRTEYDREVRELHSFLKSKRSIGCMISLFCLLILHFAVVFALI